ncbi:MAG: hypothetical protein IKA87_02045 [Lentisphaeria bacterium]|nr:hypothetical protein [Lentisphaeria bacterium]
MNKKVFLLLAAVMLLSEAAAEVYLLGPRRAGKADKLPGILPGMEKVLYKEKITVNSFPVTLEVSGVTGKMEDIFTLLKRSDLSKLTRLGNTLRFERPWSKNMVERFLLIRTRPNRPLTCFRMVVPKKLPPPEQWPSELPSLPPGAEITAITRFSNGGVCGEFRNAREPAYIQLRRVDSELRGRKMLPASNEIAATSGGRGDIYFDKNSIVWVTFHESGQGAFFFRKRGGRQNSILYQ